MHSTKFLTLFLALTAFVFTSCDKDDPEIINEEEVISALVYTLTPEGGGDTVIFRFEDLDGEGGNTPIITNDTLAANTVYNGEITLFAVETDELAETTSEIREEDDDHQFFFQTEGGATVTYADMDSDGKPIGLSTQLTTTDAGMGTMTITLRHLPNKSAEGVATGNIANAGGESDIEVDFILEIQ